MRMRKLLTAVLAFTLLALPGSTATQQGGQRPTSEAGRKLEAMLYVLQVPFQRSGENGYVAVISVGQNESERFFIQLGAVGGDPNNERLQIIQMYFLLGQIPQGAAFPPQLIKKINQWNSSLPMGRVIAADNTITYSNSAWLSKTDADTLGLDATFGHYASRDLRREVELYLKH